MIHRSNEATEHQMTSDMYGLSYVIFDKLDNFMIGLKALEERIDITYSQEDVIHSLNSILDETLNNSLQDKITVDWAEDD